MLASSPSADRAPYLSSAESRLALAEFFLSCEELGMCAEHALEWLARHAGVSQAVCLVLDADPHRLFPAASVGVPALQTGDYHLEIDDLRNPLIEVFCSGELTHFRPGKKHPVRPLGDVPFFVVPLKGAEESRDKSIGLLVVDGPTQLLSADVRWCADMLGSRLFRLRSGSAVGERQFRRERTLLYSIINAVTDPILLTDPEGKLIIANARAEKLFASRDDESEGRRRAVALNNMLFSAALASHAMAHSESARNELLLVDPSEGSDLLFELLSSAIIEPDGQAGVVSVLRNVTDLGRATEELGESYRKLTQSQAEVKSERHRLDLIIDSVADPIVVTDAAGDIVMMNSLAENLFTAPPDGDDEAQRRVRANDAHFSSFVSNLLFSGDELRWKGEIALVEPTSGTNIPVEAVAGKVLSDTGELTTVVTILHDRTEALEKAQLYEQLKNASDELEVKVQEATAELAEQNELLRRQAIQLEQASAAKSQFLANMSHEFRTPLNAILGYTSMLLQGVSGDVSAQQRKGLTRIDSNGRHLLEVINEILDITRIEAGRMPLHLSTFDMHALVKEVMAELEPIISRSRLEVRSELPPKLPPVQSDRQKVKQIVLNLLSNALKFTHQGQIRITATEDRPQRSLIISVEDTGIGIAPQDQTKVFEDFQQVDSSPTRAYGGTGLGLSICRRLVTMLGGHITLTSVLGQGSTFHLHLPRRRRG